MKCILFALMLCLPFFCSSQIIDSSGSSGKIITFNSEILKEKRKITIKIPESHNGFDVYPVMYVIDGEVQADLVNGQVAYLSEGYRIIPKMIVVSIHNTDRIR